MAIARREISSYFFSPMAYVAMALFLLASGFMFMDDFLPGQPASMRTIFNSMVWLLVFILPILSMGLLSQEKSSGTIETLMTAPVDEADVVLGKFLGSFGFFSIMLAPTFLYVVMLALYSHPEYGPIISGYLGIFLVGALFLSVGLFCSSCTRSQVVAAVTAIAVLFFVTIVPWWLDQRSALSDFWRTVINQAVFKRYVDFSKGVIDPAHLVFFVGVTAVFLFMTTKVLEARRWK